MLSVQILFVEFCLTSCYVPFVCFIFLICVFLLYITVCLQCFLIHSCFFRHELVIGLCSCEKYGYDTNIAVVVIIIITIVINIIITITIIITPSCCCCRPHSTNVLPAESSTRNHVAASSLSPQVARKGSTLSGFVQRSRLEREVGRDLHSNKWEEV